VAILLADFFNLPVAVLHADYQPLFNYSENCFFCTNDISSGFKGEFLLSETILWLCSNFIFEISPYGYTSSRDRSLNGLSGVLWEIFRVLCEQYKSPCLPEGREKKARA
jgi:hypothetical protein